MRILSKLNIKNFKFYIKNLFIFLFCILLILLALTLEINLFNFVIYVIKVETYFGFKSAIIGFICYIVFIAMRD